MKKLLLLTLAFVLCFGCICSYAYHGKSTFSNCSVGASVNDPGPDYKVNDLRTDWTASRGLSGAIENGIFEKEEDGNIICKVTESMFATGDYHFGEEDCFISVDLKCVKVGEYAGLIIDCDSDYEGYNSGSTDFSADNGNYMLTSGYGFSIYNETTIRAFINEGKEVAYADFELPFNAGEAFHTYGLYREDSSVKTYLGVDEKIIAVFDFSRSNKYEIGIYAADGTPCVTGCDNAWNEGHMMFGIIGSGVEIYFDNLCDERASVVEFPSETANFKLLGASESKAAPAPTEAPTEAPTQAPTEAPKATEAPKEETKATEAPAQNDQKTEEKSSNTGLIIGIIAAVVVIAVVVVVLVVKKKK